MAMTAFEIFGVLKLDKTDFDKGLNSAESALKGGLATAASVGAKTIGVAATAVSAFAGSAVKAGSAFDQAMGGVAATAGKTVDELDAELGEADTAYGHFSGTLREFAMYMGQNTTFSATEAAQALNYMALAGYSTQESMNMLPSVLSMAAAGSMDLAKASDAVTDIQSALGLEFDRTGTMVNEFAKAAASGNTSVEQLGDAFLVVGGLARELNGGMITLADGTQKPVDGVQELEIAFTAMANAGVKGSEAGTHMRNMLLKLSDPTDDGAASMEMLGVKVFDAEGKMRSLSDIFGDLSNAMSGNVTPAFTEFYNKFAEMSPEAIAKEFKKSADDFDYFGVSVVDEEGKLKDFSAVLSEVQTKFGEGLTQEAKIGVISDLFNTRDMASAEALLNAVNSQWDSLGEKITDAKGAADEMSKTKLQNLTGDVKLFKSALETAQITLNDQLSPHLRDFVKLGTKGLQDMTKGFNENGLSGMMDAFGTTLSELLGKIIEKVPTIISASIQLLSAFGQGLVDNAPVLFAALIEIGGMLREKSLELLTNISEGLKEADWAGMAQKLIDFIKEGISSAGDFLQVGLDIIMSLFNGIVESLPVLLTGAADIVKELASGISAAAPTLIPQAVALIGDLAVALTEPATLVSIVQSAVEIVMALAQGVLNAIPELLRQAPIIISNLVGAIVGALPTVISAGVQILVALITGIISIIPDLIALAPRLILALVGGIVQGIATIIQTGKQLIDGFVTGIKNAWTGAVTTIVTFFTGLIDRIKALFGIHSPSKVFSDIGKALIQGMVDGIKNMMSKLKEMAGKIVDVFKELPKKVIDIGKNIIEGVWEGMSNTTDWIKQKITGWVGDVLSFFKKLFGIESPSKLMRDVIGVNLGEGVAEGIEDSIPAVEDAMSDMSSIVEAPIVTATPNVGTNIVGNNYNNADAVLAAMESENGGQRELTVILELDRTQLAKAIYQLNNDETQRVGVKLAGGYA